MTQRNSKHIPQLQELCQVQLYSVCKSHPHFYWWHCSVFLLQLEASISNQMHQNPCFVKYQHTYENKIISHCIILCYKSSRHIVLITKSAYSLVSKFSSNNKKFNKFCICKRSPQLPTQRQGNKEVCLPLVITFLVIERRKWIDSWAI